MKKKNIINPFDSIMDLPRIDKDTLIHADTETTGLDKMRDKAFLLTLTIYDKDYAIRPGPKIIQWIKDNVNKGSWIFHNAKFDIHALMTTGLNERTVRRMDIHCTQVMECLIDEHLKHYSLESCCKRRKLPIQKDTELKEYILNNFPKADKKNWRGYLYKLPIEMVIPYGKQDARALVALYQQQIKELDKQDLLDVWDLEQKVTKALIFMERRGVPVDVDKIAHMQKIMAKKLIETEKQIRNLVGFDLNVRSNPQMCAAFDKLGIDYKRKKSTGNGVFDKDALKAMGGTLSGLILHARSIRVMQNLFLDNFEKFVYPDGRIRCDFNQLRSDAYGTKTGRLSASNPNLQQVPKRNEDLAKFIRQLFIASTGKAWIRADWSQFEFRMFGHYTKSDKLIKAFTEDSSTDYHQAVADLTGLDRNPYAKQLNLGLVFGMGEGLMAKKCNLAYLEGERYGKTILIAGKEAKQIFNQYHSTLPEIRPLLDKAERLARKRGFIRTLMRRRIRFPRGKGAHKAAGLMFQGSSADMMKKKLVELDQWSYKTGVPFVLVVHDEFNCIPEKDQIKDTKRDMKQILENVPEMRIPVHVDFGVGKNWWEASKE